MFPVATVDVPRTQAFYAKMFGWTYDDQPAGGLGTYTMVRKDGKDVAGLYEMPESLLQRGVPPHWMSYVAVAGADEACATVRRHGGTVAQEPFDVMDVGRMAICQDPTGATFSVWEPRAHAGCGLMGEHGTPCWFELGTKGVERAETFYGACFGWGFKHGTDADTVYREFTAPGAAYPMGGMMELKPEFGPVPPHWMIYFTVPDCDAEVARARKLGGELVVPPMDIENVGRFAVLADPAGARFAVIKLDFAPQPEPPAPKPKAARKATKKKPAKPRKK
jgi:predicted enzyme related to lactoylglutathione lyase